MKFPNIVKNCYLTFIKYICTSLGRWCIVIFICLHITIFSTVDQDSVNNGITRKDIDFRVISKNDVESANTNRKRSPADKRDAPTAKKNKSEKFDEWV